MVWLIFATSSRIARRSWSWLPSRSKIASRERWPSSARASSEAMRSASVANGLGRRRRVQAVAIGSDALRHAIPVLRIAIRHRNSDGGHVLVDVDARLDAGREVVQRFRAIVQTLQSREIRGRTH